MRGNMEQCHEHLVVLVGSFRLLPLAWACCIEPSDGLTRAAVRCCVVSVALATWHLDPPYAKMGAGQTFGEGDEQCPWVVSIFRYKAAWKRGHVDKGPS